MGCTKSKPTQRLTFKIYYRDDSSSEKLLYKLGERLNDVVNPIGSFEDWDKLISCEDPIEVRRLLVKNIETMEKIIQYCDIMLYKIEDIIFVCKNFSIELPQNVVETRKKMRMINNQLKRCYGLRKG